MPVPASPPPVPVRKSEIGIQADLPLKAEISRLSTASEGWEPPPPIPPRNHSFGTRSGIVKKKYRGNIRGNNAKKKGSGQTTGRKFWRPFKSNKNHMNTNPVPPPLPPRKGPVPSSLRNQLLSKMASWQSGKDSGVSDKVGQMSAVDMEPPPPPPPPSSPADGAGKMSGIVVCMDPSLSPQDS